MYSVPIFFILSGMVLFFSYEEKMTLTVRSISSFFVKRIARIFPLLWLATILSFVLFKSIPPVGDVFLYLTGLWAFVKWDANFCSGVTWSIGNELVYYVFFPFLLFFLKSKWKAAFVIVLIISSLVFFYFSFELLKGNSNPIDTNYYYNPLNNFFYFIGGVALAHWSNTVNLRKLSALMIIIIGILILLLYPVSGVTSNILRGSGRLVLSAGCFLICFGGLLLRKRTSNNVVHAVLLFMGNISYGVYLLHLLVANVVLYFVTRLKGFDIYPPKALLFFTGILVTLIAAHISYKYFEKPILRFTRKKLS